MKQLLSFLLLLLTSIYCMAANRYWIASSTANWNSTANWSTSSGGAGGASVPGSSDIAIFNNARAGNCTINAAVNVSGFIISGYTGTISQNSNTINIGAIGYNQNAGTFTGGNTTITLTDGDFSLAGGTFTSTSGNLLIGGAQTAGNATIFNHTAGSFNHNNGKVTFNPSMWTCSQYTYTVDVIPATTFYDIEMDLTYGACSINHIITTGAGDVVNATHDFTHTDGVINGQFKVGNNLIVNANADAGTGTITFNGTGAQTYWQAAGTPRTCLVAVNKVSGTVSSAGGSNNLSVQGFNLIAGTFTAPGGNFSIGGQLFASQTIFKHQAGTFNHNNGTVIFDPVAWSCSQYTYTIDVLPATTFYNVEANLAYGTCTINHILATATGDVITAANHFTHTDGIINGLFNVGKNLTINAGADGGTGNITFNGTGAQTYYQAASAARTCILNVNKVSGTVSEAASSPDLTSQGFNLIAGTFAAPSGNFTIGGQLFASQTIFNHQAGTFNHNNGKITFDPAAWSCSQYTYTIDVLPATVLYDVEINSTYGTCSINHIVTSATGDIVQVNHNFTHTDGIINGLFNVGNNLTINGGADAGSGTITFNGTGAQTYFQAAGTPRTCIVAVNKSAGQVTPTGTAIDFNVQGFNQIAGNFKAPPGNFNIGGIWDNNKTIFTHQAGTFNANGGKVVFDAGSYACTQYTYTIDVISATSLYDVEVNSIANSCGYAHIFATATGDVVSSTHDIFHTNGFINGQFSLTNNLTINAGADAGYGTITFAGTGAQTYYQAAGNPRTCRIGVNKTSGTVTPAVGNTDLNTQGFIETAGSFTAPSGIFYVGGSLSAVDQTFFSHQGGTFNHNNGTIVFDAGGYICGQFTYTIDIISSTLFYNIDINSTAAACGYAHTINAASGDVVTAANNIIHNNGFINGLFALKNNLTINAGADGGTGTITFTGTGAQTYYQAPGNPRTCRIGVNKASGTVTPAVGNVDLNTQGFIETAGSFTAPSGVWYVGGTLNNSQNIFTHSGGTFNHNSSSIVFDAGYAACGQFTYTIDVISTTLLYNVEVNLISATCGYEHVLTTASGDVVNAASNFTHTNGIINGLFTLDKNLIINANADGGTGSITFDGTGAQTYYQAVGSQRTCKIVVNKTSGAVTPAAGSTDFYTQGFSLLAGNFTAPTGILKVGGTLNATQTVFNHQGGNFYHNSGKVMLDPSGNTCGQYTYTIDLLPATTFYNLDMNSYYQACGINNVFATATNDSISVVNNLVFVDGISNAHFKPAGNVTVQPGFDGGTGVLCFSGGIAQNFDLTGATALFDAGIIINKTAGKVTLLSDCLLDATSQNISFIKGNIVSCSIAMLIIGDNVTTTSSSVNSFAEGPVRKVGNDAFTFPIGNGRFFAPATISAPPLATDHFTAEYFSADPNPLYNVTLKDATLDHISRAEYWNINRTNGSSNVFVTISWSILRNSYVDNLTDIKVGRWNGALWKDHGKGTVTGTTTSGTVTTLAAATSFGPFSLASASTYNPLLPVTIWSGAINTDWNTAGNWDNGVPTDHTFAIVPIVTTYPTVAASQAVGVLRVDASTVTNIASGITISVLGNLTNNGTITGAGNISLAGTTPQTIIGNGTVKNIIINNTAGVSVSNTVGNMMNITGTLTPTAGALTTNSKVTLKSTASGTARIGSGPSGGHYIIGDLMWERYIPARRAWRMITYPFSSTGAPTINASLQEGAGGTTANPNPGYGTHITGGSTANGFDQGVTNNASIKELSGTSWVGVSSTNQPITNSQGYFLFIRGSRANNLSLGTGAVSDATTLRGRGSIKQGDLSVSISGTGWKMVGNPFPSALDLSAVANSNPSVIKKNFKVWDPKLGGTNNVGGYVTASYNGATYDYVPAPVSSISEFSQPGAVFFVDAKMTGSIAVNEAHKTGSGSDNVFRPTSGSLAKMNINLRSVNADATQPIVDGAMASFDESFDNDIDDYDAGKLFMNTAENITLVRNGQYYSIERRKAITVNDTIYLLTTYMKQRRYQLELESINFNPLLVTAFLEDSLTGTSTPINVTGTTTYDFSISAGYNMTRFKIVFKPAVQVLPVTLTDLTAVKNGNTIVVNWQVQHEVNMAAYEIEKSADGIHFEKVGSKTAAGSGTGALSYRWLDKYPFASMSFYRIKMIDRDGQVKYSGVVFVSNDQNRGIVIYPNPIENNTVQLLMTKQTRGTYQLAIYNSNGQKVNNTKFTFDGNDAVKSMLLSAVLPKGIYNAEIINPEGLKSIIQIAVQ